MQRPQLILLNVVFVSAIIVEIVLIVYYVGVKVDSVLRRIANQFSRIRHLPVKLAQL
jgi:hypothetical protein